ncbi:hypothetical protein PENSPDRAFT_665071 [Peniophora sp. CONT]|nr:hypothetical protein PENSPDRAFT_665071 [Peniophora sp. CONT]
MLTAPPTDGLALPDRARREGWEFIPRNGDGYTPEVLFAPMRAGADKDRCFEQQPLLVNGRTADLPSYLSVITGGCADLDIRPPILHFGWRLTSSKLMGIIRAQFPHAIAFAAGNHMELAEFIDDEEGKQEAQIDWDLPTYMGECAMMTVYGQILKNAVLERLRVPDEYRPLFRFPVLTDKRGYTGFGLGMGTNVEGVLALDVQQRVCELFELEIESAQWYLDRKRWFWKNRAPSVKVGPVHPPYHPSMSVLEKSTSVESSTSSSSSSGQSFSGESSASSRTTAPGLQDIPESDV